MKDSDHLDLLRREKAKQDQLQKKLESMYKHNMQHLKKSRQNTREIRLNSLIRQCVRLLQGKCKNTKVQIKFWKGDKRA